ncbi:hypothetical protein BDK51DRAFT_33471, partial [Blyttiomyces helicus]
LKHLEFIPEITITTDKKETEYFTILMTHLDRPVLESQTYEEWCHWLVTDVAVTNRLVIPGGTSPLISNPIPNQPTLPGKVVLPYVPPHPAFSNPKRLHRYVITVLRQPEPNVPISFERLQAAAEEAKAQAERDAKILAAEKKTKREKRAEALAAKEEVPPHRKDYVGEGEKKLHIKERTVILPTMKFARDYGLEVASYGYFCARWDIDTPQVFTRLGIHEPVYGREAMPDPIRFVREVDTATKLASSLTESLRSLTKETLTKLRYGIRPARRRPSLYTRNSLEVELREKADAEAEAKRYAKSSAGNHKPGPKTPRKGSGIDPDLVHPDVSRPQGNNKDIGMTTVAAVALVRNKEADVAATFKGKLTERVLVKPYKYKNLANLEDVDKGSVAWDVFHQCQEFFRDGESMSAIHGHLLSEFFAPPTPANVAAITAFLNDGYTSQYSTLYLLHPPEGAWAWLNSIDAKAIGSGPEGAQGELLQQYNKSLTLREAEILSLKVLKQVMEEKLNATNVQLATITPGRGSHMCTEAELAEVIALLP